MAERNPGVAGATLTARGRIPVADRSGTVLLVAFDPALCDRFDEALSRDELNRAKIAVGVEMTLRGILDEVVPE